MTSDKAGKFYFCCQNHKIDFLLENDHHLLLLQKKETIIIVGLNHQLLVLHHDMTITEIPQHHENTDHLHQNLVITVDMVNRRLSQ